MADNKHKKTGPTDPVIEKLEKDLKELQARTRAKIAKHKQKCSKEFISAELAGMAFILNMDGHPHTVEGIKESFKKVTIKKDDGSQETWLEKFEKDLKNQRLRKIFGFPETEKS